jgi:putative hemolysin
MSLTLYAIALFIFLGLSAFFSGMEAALFSISRFRVKTLVSEDKHGAMVLEGLKSEPGTTLAAILLANLLVNIAAASIGTLILVQLIEKYHIHTTISFIIELVVMTSLLLVVGEITPKTIAISHAETLSLRFGGVVKILSFFFRPVSKLMEALAKQIVGHKPGIEQKVISDKELQVMLSEAKEFKILDDGEERFGYQILKFGKVMVDEIMTPRHKVIGVDVRTNIEDVKKTIISQKHSRMCVFDEKDDIVGVLYAKDLFVRELSSDAATSLDVRTIMREPYIVHESQHVDNLLVEFRKQGVHFAAVVDEYGYFIGIVTLEDILESLVGEIVDEYDRHDELSDVPYRKVNRDTFVFEGDISIGELARILDIEPFADEGERLSGYLFNHFKRVPREKEQMRVNDLEITIEHIHDRTIEKVMVKKKRSEAS